MSENTVRMAACGEVPLEQHPSELAAHYGPNGPATAIFNWVALILQGDLLSAWPRTDQNLRLVLAQAWIWANRSHPLLAAEDRDRLAAALGAADPAACPLWEAFSDTQLGEFERKWADFNLEEWGVASRPRMISPDHELVMFVKTGGAVMHVNKPTLVPDARLFVLRFSVETGWLVASLGPTVPIAGWPPVTPPYDPGPPPE